MSSHIHVAYSGSGGWRWLAHRPYHSALEEDIRRTGVAFSSSLAVETPHARDEHCGRGL